MSDPDLLGELDSLVNAPNLARTPCHAGRMLEGMDEDLRAKIESLMRTDSVTSAGLAQVLRKWGFDVSYGSLTRHRRRLTDGTGCACL